ncbi:Uncharacterized protein Adt_23602 [Abeliophyllum distichum]|uniref:Uncharacterized protein n=1 Tax=Abeliophyllum distichum TaxID=126358 RepID=A0ABD1SEB7_9LAMI
MTPFKNKKGKGKAPISQPKTKKNEAKNTGRAAVTRGSTSYINMKILESLQFPYLATFKEFKWMKFLEIEGRYCDEIVRCFYSNAEMLDYGSRAFDRISTYMKGKSLMINAGLLAEIFGVSLSGKDFGDKFNFLEACRVVYEDPELTSHRFDVVGLRRDMRLLHLIVVHFFKPRLGRL